MKRSPYKHWEFKLKQDRENTRMRRMRDDAYAKHRRGPTKYSRALKGLLGCAGALTAIFIIMLCVLAIGAGPGAVIDEITSADFIYGIAMRGLILLIAALFMTYLVAGWVED